jgi:TolB-like protein
MGQFFEELKRRNVLRVSIAYLAVSWLLIQVADTIFPAYGLPGSALTILITILGIGFIPAFLLAWAFELTPEGVKRDQDVDRSAPASVAAGKNFDRLIIVVLVLALGYFAFDKFVLAPDRAEVRETEVAEQARTKAVVGFYGDRSIAVLPFENMSSDPEQEYFADGIAEDVLSLLAGIRELRVISRSSAFAFKGQGLEIPEIAKRLDVAHILEGSVRKSGNRVRVTAQLIQARTDTHLWAQTYDRDLEDIFAIQDEIAADVARNLQIELLRPLPKSRATDPEVRALTQQAKQIYEISGHDRGEKMLPLLQRALEIDPDYVPALEWMGSANHDRHSEGFISSEEFERLSAQVRQRILELEPDNATLIMVDAFDADMANDKERAAELFERALSKDASRSLVLRVAGSFAINIGKFDTAIRILKHSTAIDPLCYSCFYSLSRAYMYAGNYDAALQARQRYMAIGTGGGYHFGMIKLLQGDAAGALAIYEAFPEDETMGMAGRAMAHHDLGDSEGAESALTELLSVESWQRNKLLAQAYAWMEQTDAAFEWQQLATEQDLRWARFSVFIPVFRNLHVDPRWDVWRESIELSAERLDAIEFNPDLPE